MSTVLDNSTNDSAVDVTPQAASVIPKAGWQTSQGQLTAVFTLVCMVLAVLGFHYTPDQLNDWVDRIEHMASVIVPLIVAMGPLMSYITSRGKVASNALNANAAIKVVEALPAPVAPAALMADDGWKDPHRYESILAIAKAVGVPGAAQADAVNQKIHPADLITGILGMIKGRSTTKAK